MSSSMDEDEKRVLRANLQVRRRLAASRWVTHTHGEAAVAVDWLREKESERLGARPPEATEEPDELVEAAKEANRVAKEYGEMALDLSADAMMVAEQAHRFAGWATAGTVAAFIMAALALAKSMGWI